MQQGRGVKEAITEEDQNMQSHSKLKDSTVRKLCSNLQKYVTQI